MKSILFLMVTLQCTYALALDSDQVRNALLESLSHKVTEESVAVSLELGLWSEDSSFFISTLDYGGENVFVYAVSEFEDGIRFADASWYIGDVIGEFKWAGAKKGDRREIMPFEIEDRGKKSCLMKIRKRIWISGQRYTKIRLLAIGRDGTVFQQ